MALLKKKLRIACFGMLARSPLFKSILISQDTDKWRRQNRQNKQIQTKERSQTLKQIIKLNHHLLAAQYSETTPLPLLKICANRSSNHLTTDAINPQDFFFKTSNVDSDLCEGRKSHCWRLQAQTDFDTAYSCFSWEGHWLQHWLKRETGCRSSVISQSLPLLWTSMDWKWMVRWVSDDKTQGIKMTSLKWWSLRTSKMKNPST